MILTVPKESSQKNSNCLWLLNIDPESCPRGRRCETRNFVSVMSRPRVRIPNSPPFTGFCLGKTPYLFYKVTAFSKALSENPFDVASRCEYVFAVVEKSLCPSHTCISFNVIPSCLPLLSNNEAQV